MTYDVFRSENHAHVGQVEALDPDAALDIAQGQFECPSTSQLWVQPADDEILTHTPGPWIAEGDNVYVEADDSRVAKAAGQTDDEAHRNARLIAAAPDLLEACQALTHSDKYGRFGHPDFPAAIERARKAIAKAEGR